MKSKAREKGALANECDAINYEGSKGKSSTQWPVPNGPERKLNGLGHVVVWFLVEKLSRASLLVAMKNEFKRACHSKLPFDSYFGFVRSAARVSIIKTVSGCFRRATTKEFKAGAFSIMQMRPLAHDSSLNLCILLADIEVVRDLLYMSWLRLYILMPPEMFNKMCSNSIPKQIGTRREHLRQVLMWIALLKQKIIPTYAFQ